MVAKRGAVNSRKFVPTHFVERFFSTHFGEERHEKGSG
jgi:hypothetical protein